MVYAQLSRSGIQYLLSEKKKDEKMADSYTRVSKKMRIFYSFSRPCMGSRRGGGAVGHPSILEVKLVFSVYTKKPTMQPPSNFECKDDLSFFLLDSLWLEDFVCIFLLHIYISCLYRVINKRDNLDFTPLHYAAQMWSQEVVTGLLRVSYHLSTTKTL
jgi:hypothetical protein